MMRLAGLVAVLGVVLSASADNTSRFVDRDVWNWAHIPGSVPPVWARPTVSRDGQWQLEVLFGLPFR